MKNINIKVCLARVQKEKMCYRKYFSLTAYHSKEVALEAATTWIKNIRLTLHKEFANHG